MLTDAHCHPFDLKKFLPCMEEEMQKYKVLCAASASDREEFEFSEALMQKFDSKGSPAVFPCFAIHPQLPAYLGNTLSQEELRSEIDARLQLLEEIAGQGRLSAIGETGYDLLNERYQETEALQNEIFNAHLETALRYNLPLVLHVRRAMHKIFEHSISLKKCRAVVFHSWSGTKAEAESLLARGINAYFSFGSTILLNHKRAMLSCASLPAERLLLETDAPYQPLHNSGFSGWKDLPAILDAAAELRQEAGSPCSARYELEDAVESNFRNVFDLPLT